MAKLEGKLEPFDSSVKRLFLPGLEIVDTCSKCKSETRRDLDDDYLDYPAFGAELDIRLSCHECLNEWTVKGRLSLSLELLPD